MNGYRIVSVPVLLAGLLLASCGASGETTTRESTTSAPESAASTASTAGTTSTETFLLNNALGRTWEEATHQQMLDAIEELDGDNFFLVLAGETAVLQTMYEGGQFFVDYQDATEHVHGLEYLSRDEMTEMYSRFYRGDSTWRDMVEWGEYQ